MKRYKVLLSMLCVLSAPYAIAMEVPQKEEIAQPQEQLLHLATLKKYVNIPHLIAQLVVMFSNDEYEHKHLVGILQCLRAKKLCEFLPNQYVQELFHAEQLKEFILLLPNSVETSADKRADALKKCFRTRTWKKILIHDDAEAIISCLVDLCCAPSTIPEIKLKEYQALFATIETQESSLSEYLAINNIQTILETLRKKERKLSPTDLSSCFKWDVLTEKFFACNKPFFDQIFDGAKLKIVIQKLRNKQPVTKTDLLEAISEQIYDALENTVMTEIIRILDFDTLAHILNLHFVEGKELTLELLNYRKTLFNNLEKIFGAPLSLAANTTVPQGIQTSALMTIAERFTDARVRYAMPALGCVLPIVMFMKALEAKTLSGMLCYITFAFVTTYIVYKFACSTYAKPFSARALALNAIVSNLSCQAMRAVIPCDENSIIEYAKRAYDKHPSLTDFEKFVKLISNQELKLLPSAYTICELLEPGLAPFSFIDTYTGFIESICQGDSQIVKARISRLVNILKNLVDEKDLLVNELFELFSASLDEQDQDALTAKAILSLARYKPAVLYRQHRFITSIARKNVKVTKTPLLALLSSMKETEMKDSLLHT